MQLAAPKARGWLFFGIATANAILALVLVVALWHSRNQQTELAHVSHANLGLALERNLSGLFDKIDLALQGIVIELERTGPVGKADLTLLNQRAEFFARRIAGVEALRFSDGNGVVPENAGYPLGSQSVSIQDRDYFRRLRDGLSDGMVTSNPVFGRTSKKWVLPFARAYRTPDGRFAGVIYAAVSMESLTGEFSRLSLGRNGVVTLIDPDMAIIARHPVPADVSALGKRIPQDDLVRRMRAPEVKFSETITTHVDGIERLYTFQRMAQRPYYVVLGQGVDDIYADWPRHLALAAFASLAFLLVTSAGGVYLARAWQRSDAASREAMAERERYRNLAEVLEDRVEARTSEMLHANKQLKQALEQVSRSEKFAALGGLVAGIAHEINTPIGNIRLASSTFEDNLKRFSVAFEQGQLRRSTLEGFVAESQKMVVMLDRNAVRAADLIDSIKTVAVDQTSNRRRVFDLRELLQDVLLTLRPRLKNSPHSVRVEVPPDITLNSYPGALSQIAVNLIENAMHHAFSGKTVGTLTISAAVEEQRVLIGFGDDGCGMSAEVQGKIFEAFFTTRAGDGGSGLGLHLVRALARDPLGGSVRCESVEGRGTTFIVVLPRLAPGPDVVEPLLA